MYGSQKCSLTNCYSADHCYFGLDAGQYGSGTYYDKELVTDQKAGGGKLTAEMKAKSTFAGWDFDETWGRNDAINDGYPYLRQFYPNAPADSEDPVAVSGIESDVQPEEWFTVDGRKLEGRPSKRGIYILHGRKIVIQ